MLTKVIIVGSVYAEPQRVNVNTVTFQVISKTGTHQPRPITFHVTANGTLGEQAMNLKRGNTILVDASLKTTAQGNPLIYAYSDGQPYTQYDVLAERIVIQLGLPQPARRVTPK